MKLSRPVRFRRPLSTLGLTLAVGALSLLSSCGLTSDEGRPLTTLSPKGSQSREIHNLVKPVFIVAGVVFVVIPAVMLIIAVKFRRRRGDVDGVNEPKQIHGHSALEWSWTLLPLVLLAGLAIGNVKTIWSMEREQNAATTHIEIIGQQWWWEFRYDLNGDGKPDIITANQMVIPTGEVIKLDLRSNDVIHSFWIPQLNGKKDAVPGHVNVWNIQADKPGIYQGQCTEFCGLSHGMMRMEVKALAPADYEKWLEMEQKPASIPTDATSDAGKGWKVFTTKCASCHQINGHKDNGDKAESDAPNPDYRGAQHPLIAGNAPNLTHLMSRHRFAGDLFDLYEPGADHSGVMPTGTPNAPNLADWLRDPGAMKPMAADTNRGMPNLKLPEDEIRQLVAFLTQLK
jgi:cytochrome c oxidase subunit 2